MAEPQRPPRTPAFVATLAPPTPRLQPAARTSSSPRLLVCMGPGTRSAMLWVYAAPVPPQKTPAPAAAPCLPFPKLLPSVYTTIRCGAAREKVYPSSARRAYSLGRSCGRADVGGDSARELRLEPAVPPPPSPFGAGRSYGPAPPLTKVLASASEPNFWKRALGSQQRPGVPCPGGAAPLATHPPKPLTCASASAQVR